MNLATVANIIKFGKLKNTTNYY